MCARAPNHRRTCVALGAQPLAILVILVLLVSVVQSQTLTQSGCTKHFLFGSIARQQGWTGITNGCDNAGDTFDPVLAPVDPGTPAEWRCIDRGDTILPSKLARSGLNLWWFKRGYGGAGKGPPVGPAVKPAGYGLEANSFEYSVWFRAPYDKADGSKMMIIPGNEKQEERASDSHPDLGRAPLCFVWC